MKTLLKISFMLAMGCILATNAQAEVKKQKPDLKCDLRETIKREVSNDLSDPVNFFYHENVYKLEEDVKIVFYLNDDAEIELKAVECQNSLACNYIKHLLEMKKLEIDKNLTGKMYRLNVHLIYRAI